MTETLLSESFIASLPLTSDQLDVFTRGVLEAWGAQVAEQGGYAPELAPAIERVPGAMVAKAYTLAWPRARAAFGDADEAALQVSCLSMALGDLAKQFEELVPKRVVIPGAALLTAGEKAAALQRIERHQESIVARFVADGVRQEVAEAIVSETAMVSPATLQSLLDISQPTEAKWRAAGAVPPFHKNPGRAGMVRYPIRLLVPWLVESFDYFGANEATENG